MSLESDQKPHVAKTISYGTILTLAVIIIAQLVSYGQDLEKVVAVTKDVAAVKIEMKTHVVKDQLEQRFIAQEYKIEVVSEDVKELKETINENQKMMIELLQRVPK